jgi:hypothetical protein
MKRVQELGPYEAQFQEIIRNALDKRVFIETTTPGADVEFTLKHGLNYVPIGFLVISKNKAGDVYKSATPATVSTIALKCNVATVTIRIMIF